MWIEPKTNWVSSDFMNYTDWERITGNLQHLKNIYYIPGRWRDMYVPYERNGYPTVELVNNLESNLTLVRNYLRNQSSAEFAQVTWYAILDPRYIRSPNFADFNRWEKYTLDMYMILKGMLVADTFFAGNNRTVQKFSRGREGLTHARRNFR